MPQKLNRPLAANFDKAMQLAANFHRNQVRKGTQIPYISHLLAVSSLVLEYGGTETQAIAALLHDAVEDCGGEPVLESIREQFGEDVASIVASCSDSYEAGPKRGWKERKTAHLSHLRRADPTSLLVIAADKLHNLTSMQRDLQHLGSGFWSRFSAGPSNQAWYYSSVIKTLKERLDNPIVIPLEETFSKVAPQMEKEALDRRHEAKLKAMVRQMKDDPSWDEGTHFIVEAKNDPRLQAMNEVMQKQAKRRLN